MPKKLSILLAGIMIFTLSCASLQMRPECASLQMRPETETTVIEVAAFTLGYKGCQKYPDQFMRAARVIETSLPALQEETITLQEIVSLVATVIRPAIDRDPLLEYQAKKLLGVLYIQITPRKVLVPDNQVNLIMVALPEFVAGVQAAQN
ncbi:MAG: hypothetical protein JRI58_14345 [Deltaproteobacteria bacterium]|nr:hypothetical protein [Deltaproteobacteria bacterium]